MSLSTIWELDIVHFSSSSTDWHCPSAVCRPLSLCHCPPSGNLTLFTPLPPLQTDTVPLQIIASMTIVFLLYVGCPEYVWQTNLNMYDRPTWPCVTDQPDHQNCMAWKPRRKVWFWTQSIACFFHNHLDDLCILFYLTGCSVHILFMSLTALFI